MDLTGYKDLVHIEANNNQITSLDLTQNSSLVFFNANNNQLSALDVSQNVALVDLWVSNNNIQQLDVSQNLLLESLTIDNNELHQLDISNNTALTHLSYSNNYITSIDLSNAPNLFSINLADNDYGPGDIAPKPDHIDTIFYSFSPQKRFALPQNFYNADDIIDLSAQLYAKGLAGPTGPDVTTLFTWVDNDGNPLTEGTDYVVTEPGKFQFSHALAGIYVIMKNDAYNYQEEVWDEALEANVLVDKSLYTHNGIDPNTGEYIIDRDINNNMIFRSVPVDIVVATPIKIEDFSATIHNTNILIQWHTGVEHNAKGFEIERSADAVSFENIGFVVAKGSNSSYSYTDIAPLSGKNAYRLKLIDKDGQIKYSSIVTVLNNQKSGELLIFPNPVSNGQLNITSANTTQAYIYNSVGSKVQSIVLQAGRNSINISKLSSGIYFIKTNDGKQNKFVVIR